MRTLLLQTALAVLISSLATGAFLVAGSDTTTGLRDVLIVQSIFLAALLVAAVRQRRQLVEKMTSDLRQLTLGCTDHSSAIDLEKAGLPEIAHAIRDLANSMQRRVADLRTAANRDGLTGLCNRAHFQQEVENILSTSGDGRTCALLFMDLDGFKAINDTLGHNFGDRLLQIAADRLRIATRLSDGDSREDSRSAEGVSLIARLGGDEFVYFTSNSQEAQVPAKIASRVLRVLSEPFEIGPRTVSISASIGIAQFPVHGRELNELLRSADTAMYSAKRLGKNRYELYDAGLDAETREQAEAEQELREAVVRGSLELHYQPLFDLRTMKLTSAEALIRWRHPRKGLLLPSQFLHLADRADLVVPIGEWVINEAVKRIAEFERAGIPLQISVNISPQHLERVDFVSAVKAALGRWKVDPSLLQIEVTEDVAIRDPELAADRLRQVSELGVTVAIDDFGTGYSNLSSLIMLPVSRLKIDRSLLRELTIRHDARVLVQTIISMANSLGFHSIAEGVETEAQLELLSDMGCDVVQGFFMSRPIELAQLRLRVAPLDRPQAVLGLADFRNAMAGSKHWIEADGKQKAVSAVKCWLESPQRMEAEALNRLHGNADALDNLRANRSVHDTAETHALKVGKAAGKFDREITAMMNRAGEVLRQGLQDAQSRIDAKVDLRPNAFAQEIRTAFRGMGPKDKAEWIKRLVDENDGPAMAAIVNS